MFKYCVVEFSPDKSFGIALCTDDFNLRKIIVRDHNVISGKLQIGSLIECEIQLASGDARYSGKDIRVLRTR